LKTCEELGMNIFPMPKEDIEKEDAKRLKKKY